jgi:tRNA A37 methylthiotransferase MiaB
MLELPSVVPYFDLSLQHASPGLLRSMKRWGSGDRFRTIIDRIRRDARHAAFRSSFIVGFPGETEADHEMLLAFLADVRLDWAGFFPFSKEDGTPAATMEGEVPDVLVHERLRECADAQDPITAGARASLVGETVEVLVDGLGDGGELAGADAMDPPSAEGARQVIGRTYREAPEIDGVVRLVGDVFARPGALVNATVCGVEGPDLEAKVLP